MKGLSLFSGIGGGDLAAEWAGIEPVAFCEQDLFCQKILKKHWPDVPIFDDVRDIRGDQFGDIDIVYGGFPCQDVSVVGKRAGFVDSDGEVTRSGLWAEMHRIIREAEPRWVVAENVRGLLSIPSADGRKGGGFGVVLRDLDELGYNVGWCVYGASEIGAMHQRERVFIIAHSTSKRRASVAKEQKNGRSYQHIEGSTAWGYDKGYLPFNRERLLSYASSGIVRNDDGLPDALDRIRALGNAIVPQQAYPIFKAIVEADTQ